MSEPGGTVPGFKQRKVRIMTRVRGMVTCMYAFLAQLNKGTERIYKPCRSSMGGMGAFPSLIVQDPLSSAFIGDSGTTKSTDIG